MEKFSAKKRIALSDAEDNASGLLNRGDITDLPLLQALFAKVAEAKFLENDIQKLNIKKLINKRKFGSFKNTFVMITGVPEFHFKCRRFILLVQ